jgi:hypothetical protein
MNLGQSNNPGQVCLGSITSNEYLGVDMQGGDDVDKVRAVSPGFVPIIMENW